MAAVQAFILLASALIASGQRPFFAGSRPIGFPELVNRTTTPSGLEDKFGEGTTQRLPIEAQGDRDLIDRLSKLPVDKQPFWFINWQALEAQREKPQTYPQKPNPFLESNIQNTNVAQNQNANPSFANSNPSVGNANPGLPNRNNGFSSSNNGAASSNLGSSNSGGGLRPPTWKVQDPHDNKNGNSNVDSPSNTEASVVGSTGTVVDTSSTNTVVGNGDRKPTITLVSKDIKNFTADLPGLIGIVPSKSDKNTEGPTVVGESEFEDIQVRKIAKN